MSLQKELEVLEVQVRDIDHPLNQFYWEEVEYEAEDFLCNFNWDGLESEQIDLTEVLK